MMRNWWLICLFVIFIGVRHGGAETTSVDYAAWGRETLDQIEKEFALPGRALYTETARDGHPVGDNPAFMWANGVQLSALVGATVSDKATYAPRLSAFYKALEGYWKTFDDVAAYNASINPRLPDRYYDDNEWLILSLCKAYEATGNHAYLDRAEETFTFILSGRDDKLGDGVYWHEQEKKSKNTCSNAPAAYAALRLYQITKKPDYLKTGQALYAWTQSHLQDSDGLYFDNISVEGSIQKTKWSYNTGLMLRAVCLLAQLTGDESYRKEAERVGAAAEGYWVKAETGAIGDDAQFAHLLAEGFLDLADLERKPHYRDIVRRAVQFLHDKGRDSAGHYAGRWDAIAGDPLKVVQLIHQASAARIYFVAAGRL